MIALTLFCIFMTRDAKPAKKFATYAPRHDGTPYIKEPAV